MISTNIVPENSTTPAVIPHCPVCASSESGLEVKCGTCDTLYHRDCWEYNPRCATFGCEKDGRSEESWWNRKYSFFEIVRYGERAALGTAGVGVLVSTVTPAAIPVVFLGLGYYAMFLTGEALASALLLGIEPELAASLSLLEPRSPSKNIESMITKGGV